MTDSNIQPPTTDTGTNPVPGIEVTTSPGLVPETVPTYDPNTVNVDTAIPNTVVPPSVTGTEWDGTISPPPYTAGQPDITEVPPTDYAAAVDYQVDSMSETGSHPEMPIYTESETAHQNLMQDPQYAIATHEHTLNKFADLLEKIVARLNSIEEKLNLHIEDSVGPDPNDPLADYPEVQQHQNK